MARRPRWIDWRGEPVTLPALAARVGLHPSTLRSRLARGIPLQRAVAEPPLPLAVRQRRGVAAHNK